MNEITEKYSMQKKMKAKMTTGNGSVFGGVLSFCLFIFHTAKLIQVFNFTSLDKCNYPYNQHIDHLPQIFMLLNITSHVQLLSAFGLVQ